MEYYAKQADKRRLKFNKKLTSKSIKEGSLVLRYNNRFDYNKGDKVRAALGRTVQSDEEV